MPIFKITAQPLTQSPKIKRKENLRFHVSYLSPTIDVQKNYE